MSFRDSVAGGASAAWRRMAAVVAFGLAVLGLSASARADVSIGRRWATAAPTIDGVVSPGEWSSARLTTLTHARLRTMNDGSFLYVLLDVVDDTGNDPVGTVGGNEYFTLAFDVDQNHAVSPHVDLAYATCQDGRTFVKAYYLGGNGFTGCQNTSPLSQGAVGFGPTLHKLVPHRFWEFRLDFAEIGVDPTTWTTSSGEAPHVRMNVGVSSENPSFTLGQPDPSVYPDLDNMFQLDLATSPTYPPGSAGPTFAGVGLVPSTYIDAQGYANINIANYYSATDAPFGGKLNVFGHWNTLYIAKHARSYRILYSKDGGPFTPLLQTWTNFIFQGGVWVAKAIGPDVNGRYPIPPPAQIWYLDNLLASWQSDQFADGTYQLKLQLYNGVGAPLPSPPGNLLTLFVDNTPPNPVINSISYNGAPVCACAIVTQGDLPGTGFTFDISVTDAHGALNSLSLAGIFGVNQSTGTIYGDGYGAHVGADGPHQWNGVTAIDVPATPWRASTSCAHSFILAASSRVQNGYGLVFPYVQFTTSLTILEGTGLGSVSGCSGSFMGIGGRSSLSELQALKLDLVPDPRRSERRRLESSEGGRGTPSGIR
jgi:hypothetical protein